jgi:hypothetical protein
LALNPHLDHSITCEGSVLIPGNKVAIAHYLDSLHLVVIGGEINVILLGFGDSNFGAEWSVRVETKVVGTSSLAKASPSCYWNSNGSISAVSGAKINGSTVWSRRHCLCRKINIGMSTVAFDVEASIILGSFYKVQEALLLELVHKDVLRQSVAQLIVFDSAN